jgi:hypothetical protein
MNLILNKNSWNRCPINQSINQSIKQLIVSYFFSSFCSASSGPIFSKTYEYLTFAFTQIAKGSAATDALLAF